MTPQPSYLSHFYAPSYRVLLPDSPEELKSFSLKHSPFIRIPHWGMRKEKWKFWWRPPLFRWLHDLSRNELVQKYLPTPWPGYWVARHSGTSLTWRVLACRVPTEACRGMQRNSGQRRGEHFKLSRLCSGASSGTGEHAEIILSRITCT